MKIRRKPSFPFLRLERRPLIPAVRITGGIGMQGPTGRGQDAAAIDAALALAFSYDRAPAVALSINSPGGSPVQSHRIFRRVRALAAEKDKPVIAVVEDVAASGGYMIACAGDEIIADPASIVGSIGVVSASFGLDGLLGRIGVERRVHTAGARKAILDPFQPEKAEDVAHLRSLQDEIHAQFIALVKDRRGAKLDASAELFDGLFWTGERALGLGLVDGLGTLDDRVRARFGDTARVKVINPGRGSLIRRLIGGAAGAAAAPAAEALAGALEERALWARHGL